MISLALIVLTFTIKKFYNVDILINSINASPTTQFFLGFDSSIPSFNSRNSVMLALLIILPFFYYYCMVRTANSFWHDYRYGNTFYFYSMPISRIEYWISKSLTNFIEYLLYIGVIWSVFIGISLTDCTTKVKRMVAVKSVNRIMIAVSLTCFLFFSIGVLLGSIINYYQRKHLLNFIYILSIIITILPNLINGTISFILEIVSYEEYSIDSVVNPLSDIFSSLRNFIPFYYSNPWVTQHYGINIYIALFQTLLSLFLIGFSIIFYSRKNLVKD